MSEATAPLVGEWTILSGFGHEPPDDIGAKVRFAWLAGELTFKRTW